MGIFPDAQGQVPGRILPNFKPIQDVLIVLKYKEETI